MGDERDAAKLGTVTRARRSWTYGLLAAFFLLLTVLGLMKWTTPVGPAFEEITGKAVRVASMGAMPGLFAMFFLVFAGMLVANSLGWIGANELAQLTTDEGGVRWKRGLRSGYLPFSKIRDVSAGAPLGRARLRIVHDAGVDTFRLNELMTAGGGVLETILKGVGRAKKADVPAALQRGSETVGAWLEAIQRDASSRGGYRDAAIDASKLESIARDREADVEARAGALWALSCGADAESTARACAAIGPDAPPLVQMIARALGNESVGGDAIASFATNEEREAVEALGRKRIAQDEAKPRVEVEGAQEEQEEEEEREEGKRAAR